MKRMLPDSKYSSDVLLNAVSTKELMAETYRLQQDILQQKEDEQAAAGHASKPVKPSAFPIYPKVLEKRIITYLRKMGAGSLEEAQSMEDEITPYGQQAIKILDKIALSEIPEPELANIPTAVISTIIRNLRIKIVT